ncbi:MAG: MCE family protein [Bacteroidaceae bacterium]|nr:MCE family protein [Bacteroidaceae bacterium]
MEKNKTFTRELWVGLLGILALLVIYLLINFFKGINVLNEGDKYYIKFDNIGEIVKTSPVYLNGYKVGNVSNISYDFSATDAVIVEISVDKRLQITQGSYAEVNNKMLGSSTISLMLNKDNKRIIAGDTIYGYLNGGAMKEAGEMLPKVNAMIPKIDSILISLNSILGNPSINRSIDNAAHLSSELTRTTAMLNSILKEDIPVATEKLINLENDMLAVSSQLKEIDYRKMFATLEESVNNMKSITEALNSGDGTAGLLLKDSTLYNNLNNASKAATALLEDLKKNPKRYVHFSLFGRKEKNQGN